MIPINNLKQIKHMPENFKAREINSYPYVVKINNLLKDKEIEELLRLAKGKFEKSNVMIDGELIYNKQRTSSTAYLFEDGMPDKYSKPIESMIKRICYLMNCHRSQLEIMCVRYKKGEYFGKHVDYFQENEIDDFGQRIATFFVYLNTIEKGQGGETEFTKLKIRSRPKKGDAVFWYNKNFETGEMIPETEHSGNPVTGDAIKYGLNIWMHDEYKY